MASLLSCALLLAALCWAGGDTAATNPCDLDNGGKWEDCLEKVISRVKGNLTDRINPSERSQDIQINWPGFKYSFTDIHLTGAREVQVSRMSHAILSNAVRLQIGLKWTDTKLVTGASPFLASPAGDARQGVSSYQTETGFSVTFNFTCWMKKTSQHSLELYRLPFTDVSLEASFNHDALDYSIKRELQKQIGEKLPLHAETLFYIIWQDAQISVNFQRQIGSWLHYHVLSTFAGAVTGTF